MRTLLVFFLTASVFVGFSQSIDPIFFWEGGFSFNYQLKESWSANTSFGKRSSWADDNEQFRGELLFLELDHFMTKKINPNVKISMGYKYRQLDLSKADKRSENRLTQQFAWTHQNKTIRLMSRIRTEQRFRTSSFAHRYRYRFSLDMPLSGERLDVGEFYLALSNELLFEAVRSEVDEWEDRISASFGHLFSKQIKGEISSIYRIEDLTRSIGTRIFFNTRVIIRLN